MRLVLALLILAACAVAPSPAAASFVNPVLPGEYPDPSIVRVGDEWFATATTDRWAPLFPVLHSRDLVSWEQVGSVLPRPPRWAKGGRFWAPEITYAHGRFVVTYAGLRRPGQFCIGVATATAAEGPWTESGPLTCHTGGGAIDPVTVQREDGTSWLIWKAKGAGGGLFAQQVDLQALVVLTEPVALVSPEMGWERGVNEGPTIVKRGDWWYLLYSAGTCCRPPCSYVERVARSRDLLGPYEKRREPILQGDERWRCPGHGTLTDTPDGRLFMLHHAYSGPDVRNRRRQGLLSRVGFDDEDWPVIGEGTPEAVGTSPFGTVQQPFATTFTDDFVDAELAPGWQWVIRRRRPAVRVGEGRGLELGCGTYSSIARQVAADRFSVAVTVQPAGKKDGRGWASLFARDPDGTQRGLEVRDGRVRAIRRRGVLVEVGTPVRVKRGRAVRVMVTAAPGGSIATFVRRGATWERIPEETAAEGAGPTRIGLGCRGTGRARFTGLSVQATEAQPLSVRVRGAS